MGKWTSDENMLKSGLIANGMGCKGSWCGEIRLHFIGIRVRSPAIELSGVVSDNVGKRFIWNDNSDVLAADCQEGKAITRVQCSGKHCDNIRLECAELLDWVMDTDGAPTPVPATGFF